MSKKGRRKRPGRHTVHTKDSRYNVPNYPRGEGPLATRGSGSGHLIHAPIKYRCTKCGTIFAPSTIDYYQVCPKCRTKSGVPYHGSSPVNAVVRAREVPLDKSTIIYANDEKDARSKVEARFGKVKKVEPLGVNHMGNPYYRVIYISTSEEFKEFKKYIAISPNTRELNLTEKEIVAHPRLTKAQKKTLYQHIRARSGNLPKPKTETRKDLELNYIKAFKKKHGTWEGIDLDKSVMSMSDSELRKSTKSLKGRTAKSPERLSLKGNVGHYGGYFIDIPPSELPRFKAMFPKGTFPRKTSVREGTVYVDGKPTTMLSVQFREGTKAIEHLDNLEKKGELKLKIT